MPAEEIQVHAPGRICLFGEHQDYLKLPVISAAITLFVNLRAVKAEDKNLTIDLLDLNQRELIPLKNREINYQYSRDYLRSAYNLFIRKGYRLNQGYVCQIQGTIPINAGVGSSSALIIAWITFLSHVFNARLSPPQIAELGYQAEVDEFREAGGRMDHYTSALGGILYITTSPPYSYEYLNASLTGFVLGDSLERKNTIADLFQVKEQVQLGLSRLRQYHEDFNLHTSTLDEISSYLPLLPPELANSIIANLINRDLTLEAKELLSSRNFSPKELGKLLDSHHLQLAQNLGISTPKIEELIAAAKDAGALGCKVNGSGFGGCMIAYAPDNAENVANAIEKAGGKAYILSISEGCKIIKE